MANEGIAPSHKGNALPWGFHYCGQEPNNTHGTGLTQEGISTLTHLIPRPGHGTTASGTALAQSGEGMKEKTLDFLRGTVLAWGIVMCM